MFSIINGGWKEPNVSYDIPIDLLKLLIENNPHKEKILKLHTLVKGCESYDEIKAGLPCVKPHGTFDKYCLKENFKKFSGYIFFDVDKGEIDKAKDYLLNTHKDKIAMLGKSVGGKGIFFYVKIGNPQIVTPDNFLAIQNYFIKKVFTEIEIDNDARGINRNQVIPYDNNLYFNNQASINISANDIKNKDLSSKKCMSSCNKSKVRNVNTTTHTFLPISEVNNHIIWTTQYDIGDAIYVIGEFEQGKLHIPERISDGKKHKTFRAMVNIIMYNNSRIQFKYVVSFINYVNQYYTGSKKMKTNELVFVVQSEYDRIKAGGKIYCTKRKYVITNSALPKKLRHKYGCKGVGELKEARSKDLIRRAVNHLKEHNEKPTITNAAEVLKGKVGKLGISTIKKHWRAVVPIQITDKSKLIDDKAPVKCISTVSANTLNDKSKTEVNNKTVIIPMNEQKKPADVPYGKYVKSNFQTEEQYSDEELDIVPFQERLKQQWMYKSKPEVMREYHEERMKRIEELKLKAV